MIKSTIPQRPASGRRIVRAMTRVAALALLLLVALGLPTAARADESPAPTTDVRADNFGGACARHGRTEYTFLLRNTTDHRRGVRGRVVWRNQGFTTSFSRRVPAGRGEGTIQRLRVSEDEEAVVTFRSQGQVIGRYVMVGGPCRRTL